MEAIWTLAQKLGVRILTDPDWVYSENSAWYGEARGKAFVLLPAVIPIRLERWLIAHELGHHVHYQQAVLGSSLGEAKADRWAVATLLEHYDFEDVEWPERLMRQPELFHAA